MCSVLHVCHVHVPVVIHTCTVFSTLYPSPSCQICTICLPLLKVLLIVNVASLCGYTDINYRELIWLQQHHAPQGFSVLAFPCNQFGAQEPWPEEDILAWVEETYADVNFPLFSKVKVFGDDADPLYKYLVRETGSGPRWNFAKYLVNRNGVPVAFFTTTSSFEDVNRYLEGMLEGKDEL